jgi:Mg/Co/Ni transporter MgtE
MVERYRPKSDLLPPPPLLVTESMADFDRLCDAFNEDIKPRGPIERIYVSEIANIVWEILRLHRFKAAVINNRINDALRIIILRLLPQDRDMGERQQEARELARNRVSDQGSRRQVLELLKQNNRDESEAEVKAIRESLAEVEQIDRLLASLGSRLNKALRQIFEYRRGFAQRLRDTSNRIIEGKVLALEHSSNNRPRADA